MSKVRADAASLTRSVRSKRASGKVESSRYSREEKGELERESATELVKVALDQF